MPLLARTPSSQPIFRRLKSDAESAQKVPEWAKPGIPALSCTDKPARKPATYQTYLELAKPRLTWLVVLSTMSSYALAPHDLSLAKLALLTTGTALCSASANSINMGREGDYDVQMTRTRKRPIPSGRLKPKDAFGFAAATGLAGTAALYWGISPLVALLGFSNIALYGGLYTTLKRKHIANTWVGAVVGAIPPLMGWAACSSLADPGAWMLAALLYSWQFPHFMALSYAIADEYKNAGYVMSAWTDPLLTARVALRHSVAMFPICFGLSYFGVTDFWFCLDSAVVNGWMAWTSFLFWRNQKLAQKTSHSGEEKKYARQLFWASVIHLPVVLVLAMLHKKGRWDWLFENQDQNQDGDQENDQETSYHATA